MSIIERWRARQAALRIAEQIERDREDERRRRMTVNPIGCARGLCSYPLCSRMCVSDAPPYTPTFIDHLNDGASFSMMPSPPAFEPGGGSFGGAGATGSWSDSSAPSVDTSSASYDSGSSSFDSGSSSSGGSDF